MKPNRTTARSAEEEGVYCARCCLRFGSGERRRLISGKPYHVACSLKIGGSPTAADVTPYDLESSGTAVAARLTSAGPADVAQKMAPPVGHDSTSCHDIS